MVLTPLHGDAGDIALGLLAAVDEGRPAGDLGRALALSVIASETPGEAPWMAAAEVIEGGPLRIWRAVALAGWPASGVWQGTRPASALAGWT